MENRQWILCLTFIEILAFHPIFLIIYTSSNIYKTIYMHTNIYIFTDIYTHTHMHIQHCLYLTKWETPENSENK